MSLKDLHKKEKKKPLDIFYIIGQFLACIMVAGILALPTLLWNYIAPFWGLPKLNFFQITATVVLVDILILQFLILKGIIKGKSRQNVQIVKLPNTLNVEDFPDELQ